MRVLKRLLHEDRGATAIEYALILAMIFLAMVGALKGFASTSIAMWNNVADNVTAER